VSITHGVRREVDPARSVVAKAAETFFEVGPRRVFLLGFLGNPGFGSTPAARLRPGKD